MGLRRTVIACVIALAFLGCTAATALADVGSEVSGTLDRGGALVQYPTYRTHTYAGVISIRIDNMCWGWLHLGLRNTAGTQFTNSAAFTAVGQSADFIQTNGSAIIAKGKEFAINGRMKAGGGSGDDNSWSGYLVY